MLTDTNPGYNRFFRASKLLRETQCQTTIDNLLSRRHEGPLIGSGLDTSSGASTHLAGGGAIGSEGASGVQRSGIEQQQGNIERAAGQARNDEGLLTPVNDD